MGQIAKDWMRTRTLQTTRATPHWFSLSTEVEFPYLTCEVDLSALTPEPPISEEEVQACRDRIDKLLLEREQDRKERVKQGQAIEFEVLGHGVPEGPIYVDQPEPLSCLLDRLELTVPCTISVWEDGKARELDLKTQVQACNFTSETNVICGTDDLVPPSVAVQLCKDCSRMQSKKTILLVLPHENRIS